MASREEQDAWVSRVLGVSVGTDSGSGDLDQELQTWRLDMLGQAARLTDGEARKRIEALGQQAASLIADGKLGAAHSILDAMSTALLEAQRKAKNEEVTRESGSKVEYAKLMLRWRKAQSDTRGRIQELAAQLLADEEVKADPRYDDVVEAASDLVDVMPGFGQALEDLLDGLDRITDPAERARNVEAARGEIEKCRQLLDTADELAELAEFAADEYAQGDLADELRDALTEIAGTLAGAD
jgi:hypothetical protein